MTWEYRQINIILKTDLFHEYSVLKTKVFFWDVIYVWNYKSTGNLESTLKT